MKLHFALLGIAAAAVSLCKADVVRQSSSSETKPPGSPNEPAEIQACMAGQLKLSIAEANGTASFRCSTEFPELSPAYTGGRDQQVFFGSAPNELVDVLPSAKLEKTTIPVSASSVSTPASEHGTGSPAAPHPDVYTLTVPRLPSTIISLVFRCIPEIRTEAERQRAVLSKECQVIFTVASSAARPSVAARSALAASAIAGLLSMTAHSIPRLPAQPNASPLVIIAGDGGCLGPDYAALVVVILKQAPAEAGIGASTRKGNDKRPSRVVRQSFAISSCLMGSTMKLPLAPCLGAAAAIALCFREASAVRQATSHLQLGNESPENVSPTEQKVPTCDTQPVKLSISAANGTAAFKCAKDSELSPQYQQTGADQQVFIGETQKKLSEVLANATLKREPTIPETNKKNTMAMASSPAGSQETMYTLTVPELPEQEKSLIFKCTNKSEQTVNRQDENEVKTECIVTITVASSAAEKAFAVHSRNPGGVVPNWHSVAEVSFLSSSTKAGRTVSIAPQFF
ncbi:hypothetical protein BESB_081720 [Besnoitia besnoiti]|uniref:SRS domain-containing protein n=1 Tax=Besnoitia besnoiti TaxID=94643 RepID=A0A2A9MBC6_BESBE|nr:hypothetical protein BESB_081720 [Besnoitia besnoiti]PFH32973.1 hypothetical protein BESB_081720 [Besnoitia besnoiti]